MAKQKKSPKDQVQVVTKLDRHCFDETPEIVSMCFDYATAAGYILTKTKNIDAVELTFRSGAFDVSLSFHVSLKK